MLKLMNGEKTIAENVLLTASPWRMGWGLMFHRRPKPIIFDLKRERRASLHMVFVFFPLDILFLDKDKKVVEKKESFKPFAFYFSEEKCRYIVELPEGKAKGVSVGETVSFER